MDFLKYLLNVFRPPRLFGKDLQESYDKGVEGITNSVGNMLNKFTGSALTDAEKSTMDYSHDLQKQGIIEQYELQREGMQKAGLNPAMMYGNGQVGNGVGTPQTSSSPETLSSLLGMFTNLMMNKFTNQANVKVAEMNNRTNLQLQSNELAFQSDYMKTNTESIKLRNQWQEIQNRIQRDTEDLQLDNIWKDNQLKSEQIYNAKALRGNMIEQTNLLIEQAKTEIAKRQLMATQRYLHSAQAWQIYRLTPSLEQLYNAQTFSTTMQGNYIRDVQLPIGQLDKELHIIENHIAKDKGFTGKLYRYSRYGGSNFVGSVTGIGAVTAGFARLFGHAPAKYSGTSYSGWNATSW